MSRTGSIKRSGSTWGFVLDIGRSNGRRQQVRKRGFRTRKLAQTALNDVNQALSAVTDYAALIGATQDRMTTANTFNTALMTNYANGVSGMVDADMNTASTQLQALQTQEQLGIQSLSIANQNAALILKLFQ